MISDFKTLDPFKRHFLIYSRIPLIYSVTDELLIKKALIPDQEEAFYADRNAGELFYQLILECENRQDFIDSAFARYKELCLGYLLEHNPNYNTDNAWKEYKNRINTLLKEERKEIRSRAKQYKEIELDSCAIHFLLNIDGNIILDKISESDLLRLHNSIKTKLDEEECNQQTISEIFNEECKKAADPLSFQAEAIKSYRRECYNAVLDKLKRVKNNKDVRNIWNAYLFAMDSEKKEENRRNFKIAHNILINDKNNPFAKHFIDCIADQEDKKPLSENDKILLRKSLTLSKENDFSDESTLSEIFRNLNDASSDPEQFQNSVLNAYQEFCIDKIYPGKKHGITLPNFAKLWQKYYDLMKRESKINSSDRQREQSKTIEEPFATHFFKSLERNQFPVYSKSSDLKRLKEAVANDANIESIDDKSFAQILSELPEDTVNNLDFQNAAYKKYRSSCLDFLSESFGNYQDLGDNIKMWRKYTELLRQEIKSHKQELTTRSQKIHVAINSKFDFMQDEDLRNLCQRRYDEIAKLKEIGCWESAALAVGFVIEGVFLEIIEQHETLAKQSKFAPHQGVEVKPIKEWSMQNLKDVATDIGIIPKHQGWGVSKIKTNRNIAAHPSEARLSNMLTEVDVEATEKYLERMLDYLSRGLAVTMQDDSAKEAQDVSGGNFTAATIADNSQEKSI